MAFDFSKLSSSKRLDQITNPVELFGALPNKQHGYGYLRAVQKTILDSWSTRRDQRDLVIKANTGSGKTIAALLILRCCLNEQKGPGLYLAPDEHLARRVREEASSLGLDVAGSPEDPGFLNGSSIGVMTMKKLFNGMSKFGVSGSGNIGSVDLGSIVIDDAHAAIALVEEQARMVIPAEHQAYGELLKLFRSTLVDQCHNDALDIEEGVRGAVMRIPFWSWRDRQSEVLDIIRPHRSDNELKWQWPLIADILAHCHAVITAEAIEISPPCPPIEKFPSFQDAERRIYMTATLADDSVLVTHFGADSTTVSESIAPDTASDLGERLVLAPMELNASLDVQSVRHSLAGLSELWNTVVLVPSWKMADRWAEFADETVSKPTEIDDVVKRLNKEHVGLVVIVNRFDGIDLPDDACRLLIIDGVPQATSGSERRAAIALRDSDLLAARQMQRIEQGMGRGVRSIDDRCAVILLGAELTTLLNKPSTSNLLSPATRAQLTLSRQVSNELSGASWEVIDEIIRQVAYGDPDFRKASREALLETGYEPTQIDAYAQLVRSSFDALTTGRTFEAASLSQEAVNNAINSGDDVLAGWLGEALADVTHITDRVEAQKILQSAIKRNSRILRPIEGTTYKHLKKTAAQADRAEQWLSGFEDPNMAVLAVTRILEDLEWDDNRTNQAEQALADLASVIGFEGQRPERDFNKGSDVLWSVGESQLFIIEAKTGASTPFISKTDINQLAGSVNWCTVEYPGSATTPLLVHPASTVDAAATPPTGTRVITSKDLGELKAATLSFVTALSAIEMRDREVVQQHLAANNLTPNKIVSKFTTKPSQSSNNKR